MGWPTRLLVTALALTAVASAEARTAVVAAGDCSEHQLISNAMALASHTEKTGAQVLQTEDIRSRLRVFPAKGLGELESRIDAALRFTLNDGRFVAALRTITTVLEELDRVPVGPERARVALAAHEAAALIYFANNREAAADDSFRTLLRLDPAHRINRGRFDNVFSPMVVARFERHRREQAARLTATLHVKSTPSGAQVFLDGAAAGIAPVSVRVEPRTYKLQLLLQGAHSLIHEIPVSGEARIAIDLAFESSIVVGPALCLRAKAGQENISEYAIRLGERLDAQQVLLARLSTSKTGEAWFNASLFDVKRMAKVREGSLRIIDPSAIVTGLPDLATFVITGDLKGSSVITDDPPVVAARPSPPPAAPATALLPTAHAAPRPPAPPFPWVPASLAGGGLGATAAGFVFAFQAAHARGLQEELRPNLRSYQLDYILALERIEAQRRGLAILSFGLGALSLGGAVYVYLRPSAPKPTPVAFSIGPGGASLVVSH